jgi:saccharopine dehydrogenase (NAD+, L-lysine-forming)
MNTFLIRAEDKNIWERRAPIVPGDLADIVKQTGASAFIQSCEKRYFKSAEYQEAGAVVCDDMAPAKVIFGVKEIPEEKILDDKVYVIFSHTIKGQKSGMPLLKRIMASGSTLIDYEKITDAENRRLVYFGRYAGDAGAIDILSLMGEHWQHHGLETPFVQVRRAHQYDSVDAAKAHLQSIGETIRTVGLPAKLSPMVIGILGYGNVAGGVQQILACLPHKQVAAAQLAQLNREKAGDSRTVYVCVFKEKDLVQRKDGAAFDLQDYFDHPEGYESRFSPYLAHITILVNAVYWEPRYPRFVTWENLKQVVASGTPKLCGIADITCDTHGSIECNERSTDSSMPAYLCDPVKRTTTDGHTGDGIVLLAVDNLPCELPYDASTFFSRQLKVHAASIVAANYQEPLEASGLSPEVQKAVIVYNGKLTPPYAYLKTVLEHGT